MEKAIISARGFKDIWASDRFRLLFSTLGLNQAIPSESVKMKQLSKNTKMNWLDSPHALTEIRNTLVHPDHNNRDQVNSILFEAWTLGLWYLELSILATCGYTGTYRSRLKNTWVGQVENVPWLK